MGKPLQLLPFRPWHVPASPDAASPLALSSGRFDRGVRHQNTETPPLRAHFKLAVFPEEPYH